MLALYDPDLADVDFRDPELDEDIKIKIIAEIVRNPWAFIREVVLVKVSGGSVPYKLHLGNLFLTWCMIANINCFLVLPRQNYKTVSACAMYLWSYCFGTTNSHVLFFNKALGDSQNNLKRVKDLYELLPDWLREGALDDPLNDRNAIEYIYSAHRNNRIDPKPAGTSREHADLLGRGSTVPQIWYDEIAFAKFIYETYMAAAPAQAEARASAVEMGVPYGTVITTTPNSLNDPSGEFAFRIRSGALFFRLEFYDLGPAAVRELIESQAEYNYLYAEYTYKELGRSEAWFRAQVKELLNDQLKIKRELLLIWPMSTEGSVFTEEQLEKLLQFKLPQVGSLPIRPRSAAVPPGLEMQFVEPPDPQVPYIVGIDSASGEGLDYSAIVVCHPDDLRQVGFIKTNTADDDALKAVVVYVLVDVLPKAIAVVERNYLGIVIVNHLLKIPEISGRIFYLDKEKMAERIIGGQRVKSRRKVRVYGVDTSAESRDAMMRHLFQVVDELPHLVRLGVVQDEIRTLHRKKTGKIEHRPGFHDDVLMAWLTVMYADRHEQPNMRALIARQRGGKMGAVAARVSALNASVDVGPATAAGRGHVDIEIDEYLSREQQGDADSKRRRQLASIVAAMNSSGQEFPT
jgi:hypothetical protein